MINFLKYFAVKKRIFILYAVALFLLCFAAAFGVLVGSTNVGFKDFLALLSGYENGVGVKIILYIRLPRTLAAVLVGGALSVSGMILQRVLANKLASPSLIGVNSGAGVAVNLCAALGVYGGFYLSLWSFIGAFTVALCVSFFSKKVGASRSTVILMGVAVNSVLNALSDAIVTLNPDISAMSRDFKVGDFSSVTYSQIIPSLVLVLFVMLLVCFFSNELDVITFGEENAAGLGMNVAGIRTVFLLLAALLSGCAVSIAGLLSFVGLIVPNIIRKLGGERSLHLSVLSFVFGGAFTAICDTLARTLFTPYEIPVGIIMALAGAPVFVFILIKGKGGHGYA